MALWSKAGARIEWTRMGTWWAAAPKHKWPQEQQFKDWLAKVWEPGFGDRRNELVFIGVDLDEKKLRALVTSCLVSDEELLGVTSGKEKLLDPFPNWLAEARSAALA
jgi:hypothetical protein